MENRHQSNHDIREVVILGAITPRWTKGRFQPCVPGSFAGYEQGVEVNGTVYIAKELSGRAGITNRLEQFWNKTGSGPASPQSMIYITAAMK